MKIYKNWEELEKKLLEVLEKEPPINKEFTFYFKEEGKVKQLSFTPYNCLEDRDCTPDNYKEFIKYIQKFHNGGDWMQNNKDVAEYILQVLIEQEDKYIKEV